MEKEGKNLSRIRRILVLVSIVCLFCTVVIMIVMVFQYRDLLLGSSGTSIPEAEHRILYISSYDALYYPYDDTRTGLEQGLYPGGVEYDVVFMDAKTHSSKEDLQAFHDYLQVYLKNGKKYEGVLVRDDVGLKFVMQYREEFFPGMPVVFFGVNDLELAREAQKDPLITGLYETDYLQITLDVATRLFPEYTHMVALHDSSTAGATDAKKFYVFEEGFPGYKFSDINTSEYTEEELGLVLEELPEDTILIYMTAYLDIYGKNQSLRSRTATVVEHAHVPVFRNYPGCETMGIIGGVYLDLQEHSRIAAQTLSDIVNGADPASYDLVLNTPYKNTFDYSVLARFGIREDDLPEGTVFVNKPESFTERYGGILPLVTMLLVALVSMLLASRISIRGEKMVTEQIRASRDDLVKSQEKLKYQAEHDDFLHLLNRKTAMERMERELAVYSDYAIILSHVDGFTDVNDRYGHRVADQVLKSIADQLRELCLKNSWMIARYRDADFLFWIKGQHLTANHEIINSLQSAFHSPVSIGSDVITLSASMGISNSDGVTTPEKHVLNAEFAMRRARERGRNGAFVYDEEMKEKAREEIAIKEKILEAFDNDGFFMVYQPQVGVESKQVTGYEALLRMKAPGMYPGVFIPIAERNGWIWRIGRITTELVVRQLAAWRDEGRELRPVSVNFSSNQLNDKEYLGFLKGLLRKYDIPAKYIEIEITEGLFLERTAQAEGLFASFKEAGIKLLMDDFGTGYSSLGYLTYIPVDVIKLDKSLVDAYLVEGKAAFIKDVVQMVHDLDMEMIVEGVEEQWQYEKLKEFGADTIQGYYFSKPLPPEEAIVFDASDK